MNVKPLFKLMVEKKASDLFFAPFAPAKIKIEGKIIKPTYKEGTLSQEAVLAERRNVGSVDVAPSPVHQGLPALAAAADIHIDVNRRVGRNVLTFQSRETEAELFVERLAPDAIERLSCPLPALVTVSSEIGELPPEVRIPPPPEAIVRPARSSAYDRRRESSARASDRSGVILHQVEGGALRVGKNRESTHLDLEGWHQDLPSEIDRLLLPTGVLNLLACHRWVS